MTERIGRTCLAGALLALAIPAAAQGGPDTSQLRGLMREVASIARAEYKRAVRSSDEIDRRIARQSYALILYRSSGCTEVTDFVRGEPQFSPVALKTLLDDISGQSDRACVGSLAPVMLQRIDSSTLAERDRLTLRFAAGSFLDASGSSEGQAIMAEAHGELRRTPDNFGRWNILFDALSAYRASPARNRYLEFLAGQLAQDGQFKVPESVYNGLHLTFATADRCDLVGRLFPQKSVAVQPPP